MSLGVRERRIPLGGASAGLVARRVDAPPLIDGVRATCPVVILCEMGVGHAGLLMGMRCGERTQRPPLTSDQDARTNGHRS